jgi:hypothetical protein
MGPLAHAEPATQPAAIRARVFWDFVILGSSLFVTGVTGAGGDDFSGAAPLPTFSVS